MSERSLHRARILSSIAATSVALACGTNYVYSAWGPQFADKLRLSATQGNLIGSFGNLGMYAIGIPLGILIDSKGPKLPLLLGVMFMLLGYFLLYQSYDRGLGSFTMMCIFSMFTGFGGCAAFNSALKVSALNWPHHRGKATGFPLAAFGLSAAFWSLLGQILVPGSTSKFLMLLAFGTSGIVATGFCFLRVLPHSDYLKLPVAGRQDSSDSTQLHRSKSEERKYGPNRAGLEPGRSTSSVTNPHEEDPLSLLDEEGNAAEIPEDLTDESSSLVSKSSTTSSNTGQSIGENSVKDRAHRVDIRGLQMLPLLEFWQLFILLGINSGVGLMTINNTGNNVNALWLHYDDSASRDFIMKRQAMHVSALSLGSFGGRLLSGFASDFLVKTLHASRLWCIVLCSLVFLAAQTAGYTIRNPHFLIFVSSLNGTAYGLLFGCFPSLTAEAFGIHGLATNWGCMTLAPVIFGNIFNIFYGVVFDRHSVVKEGGERECTDGLECYRGAYMVTLIASVLGMIGSFWSIFHTHRQRLKEGLGKENED